MKKRPSSSCLLSGLAVLVIALGISFLATPCIFRALPRAALAEAVNNTKQVKLALDSFAMDNDGLHPCAETAAYYKLPVDGSSKPMRLNAENRLLDAQGKELLTIASDVWKGKLGRPDLTRIEIAYPLKR